MARARCRCVMPGSDSTARSSCALESRNTSLAVAPSRASVALRALRVQRRLRAAPSWRGSGPGRPCSGRPPGGSRSAGGRRARRAGTRTWPSTVPCATTEPRAQRQRAGRRRCCWRAAGRGDRGGRARVGVAGVREQADLAHPRGRRFAAAPTSTARAGRGPGSCAGGVLTWSVSGDWLPGAGRQRRRGIVRAGRFDRPATSPARARLGQRVGRGDAAEAGVGEHVAVDVAQHHVLAELARVADLHDAPVLDGHHGRVRRAHQVRRAAAAAAPACRCGVAPRRPRPARARPSSPARSRRRCARWRCPPAGRRARPWPGAADGVASAVALDVDGDAVGSGVHGDLLAGDRQAAVDQAGERGDHGLGIGRDQLRAQQHRVDIFFGVVVGEDRARAGRSRRRPRAGSARRRRSRRPGCRGRRSRR